MIDFKPSGNNESTGIYTEATRLSPISKTKKKKVLADYGIKTGWAKGKSDPAISKQAAAAVLKKFKADQKKATDAKKPAEPAKAPTVKPVTTNFSRAAAAALIRSYGADPAKLIGWGASNAGSMWVNAASQAYIWRNKASFEAWLRRAIKYNG